MTSTDGKARPEATFGAKEGQEYWFHNCPKAGYPTPGARVTTMRPYPCNSCGKKEAELNG